MDVLITGANSGIGYETAKQLLARGYKVHVVCRDAKKTAETVERLREYGQVYKAADELHLDDLLSVRAFCETGFKLPHLNILICNAGVMGLSNLERTVQGFEMHVGVNYLAHFLLTRLLMDKLKMGARLSGVPSRIVNVSGEAYMWAKGAVDVHRAFEGGPKDKYHFAIAYGHSKLFQIWDSETVTEQQYPDVISMALHPGVIHTNLMRSMDARMTKRVLDASKDFLKTVEEGAQTTVFCTTASLRELGVLTNKSARQFYYQDCKRSDLDSEMVDNITQRRELERWSKLQCGLAKL